MRFVKWKFKIAPELHQNCPIIARKTFELIKENSNKTTAELAAELGITERTVKTHIVLLKEAGLIERERANKHGRWKIPLCPLLLTGAT